MSFLVSILVLVPFIVVSYLIGALLRRMTARLATKLNGYANDKTAVLLFLSVYAGSVFVAYEVMISWSTTVENAMLFFFTYVLCSFLAFPAYESTDRYAKIATPARKASS